MGLDLLSQHDKEQTKYIAADELLCLAVVASDSHVA